MSTLGEIISDRELRDQELQDWDVALEASSVDWQPKLAIANIPRVRSDGPGQKLARCLSSLVGDELEAFGGGGAPRRWPYRKSLGYYEVAEYLRKARAVEVWDHSTGSSSALSPPDAIRAVGRRTPQAMVISIPTVQEKPSRRKVWVSRWACWDGRKLTVEWMKEMPGGPRRDVPSYGPKSWKVVTSVVLMDSDRCRRAIDEIYGGALTHHSQR